MSEYADKHSNTHRKERVDHILGSSKTEKVDASGYTVPGELDTERKTGPCQPKPRAYAKGGKVEGHKAHHHAGRKSRGLGGETAVEQLRPQVPTGGLYGSGFSPTHAGMLSNAAGLKKGGEAKRHKRASGGPFTPNSTTGNYLSPDLASMSSARVAAANRDKLKAAMTKDPNMNEELRQNNRDYRDVQNSDDNPQHDRKGGAVKRRAAGGGIANEVTGVRITGGRKARKEGGRAKGKTNINIIIGSPKEQQPAVPPPPSAMPPPPMPMKPGLPPAAMGAMSGPGGGAPPMMPAQMPPGVGPR